MALLTPVLFLLVVGGASVDVGRHKSTAGLLPAGPITIKPSWANQETNTHVRHCHFQVFTTNRVGNAWDFLFTAVTALDPEVAKAGGVSLHSVQLPDLYLTAPPPLLDGNALDVEPNRLMMLAINSSQARTLASWHVSDATTSLPTSAAVHFANAGPSGGYMSTNGALSGVCCSRYDSKMSSDLVLATTPLHNASFVIATATPPEPPSPPPSPAPPPPGPPCNVTVTVNPSNKTQTISEYMTGCGLEDINHEINGGLYAQMLNDEGFETTSNESLHSTTAHGTSWPASNEPTSTWRARLPSVAAAAWVVNSSCYTGLQCLRLTGAGASASQAGLLDSGLYIVGGGNTYTVQAQAAVVGDSCPAGTKLTGTIGVVNRSTVASSNAGAQQQQHNSARHRESSVDDAGSFSFTIAAHPSSSSSSSSSYAVVWQAVKGILSPLNVSEDAALEITLDEPGPHGCSLQIDAVVLMPGPWGLYKGLPVRRDLGELIEFEQLSMIRLGGGMINSNGWAWKNQVGPPHSRQPNLCGVWDSVMSNGWGVFDFLNLAEAVPFRPIVSVHLGTVSLANQTYLCSDADPRQDAHNSGGWNETTDPAGYIEYLFGDSVTTNWGKQRAADGHPAPYAPFTMALSNEEGCGDAYFVRASTFMMEAIATVLRLSLPTNVVKLDFAYACDAARMNPWKPNPAEMQLTQLAANLTKTYPFVTVNWDQHTNGDTVNAPTTPTNFTRIFAAEQEQTAAWGHEIPILVLEENGVRHDLSRALGHARNAFAFQRMGEHVLVQAYANCFQPVCSDPSCVVHYSQGGKMFLPGGPPLPLPLPLKTNRTWLSPHGYATQLLASSYRPQGVSVTFSLDGGQTGNSQCKQLDLDAMAAITDDDSNDKNGNGSGTGSLVVRFLNPNAAMVNINIQLSPHQHQNRRISSLSSAERLSAKRSSSTKSSSVTLDTLSGPNLDADNSFEAPNAVRPVRSFLDASAGSHGNSVHALLPAWSFSAFTIPLTPLTKTVLE